MNKINKLISCILTLSFLSANSSFAMDNHLPADTEFLTKLDMDYAKLRSSLVHAVGHNININQLPADTIAEALDASGIPFLTYFKNCLIYGKKCIDSVNKFNAQNGMQEPAYPVLSYNEDVSDGMIDEILGKFTGAANTRMMDLIGEIANGAKETFSCYDGEYDDVKMLMKTELNNCSNECEFFLCRYVVMCCTYFVTGLVSYLLRQPIHRYVAISIGNYVANKLYPNNGNLFLFD